MSFRAASKFQGHEAEPDLLVRKRGGVGKFKGEAEARNENALKLAKTFSPP